MAAVLADTGALDFRGVYVLNERMLLSIGTGILVGLVGSSLGYFHIIWVTPRLPKSPFIRMLLGMPTAVLPMATGMLCTRYLPDSWGVGTADGRLIFVFSWAVIELIRVFNYLTHKRISCKVVA
jgi:hypothetical protein